MIQPVSVLSLRLLQANINVENLDSADPDMMSPVEPPTENNLPSGIPSGGPGHIGKYSVLRELGRGNMGIVLAAEDPQLQRQVAIKLLSVEAGNISEAQQRFLREARAVARLNHPNVVVIHEINEESGQPYLVTELVSGGSLQKAVETRGPLPWREATKSLIDACHGLIAAHAAGLIHRDIKPANLLRSDTDTVKIADFGLAKGPQDSTTLTAAGTVFGTPHYMSPEQWAGEPLTPLTDIYSLGGTYYTLLTGKRPFGDRDPLQIMYACCSGSPPDPQSILPDLPATCTAIVQRAMARNLEDRYPSASALLEDLEQLLTDPEFRGSAPATDRISHLATRPNQVGKQPASEFIRSRRLVISAVSFATIAIGLIAFALWPKQEWIPLFNGRNLNGWTSEGTWNVEKGLLVGSGNNSSLLSIRNDFRNFQLRAEVLLRGDAQAGILLRTQKGSSGLVGYRINLTTGDMGGINRLINETEPRALFSDGRAVDLEHWETIEATFEGTGLQVVSGGRTTAEITEEMNTDPRQIPSQGEIGFIVLDQSGQVVIRRLEVKPLP